MDASCLRRRASWPMHTHRDGSFQRTTWRTVYVTLPRLFRDMLFHTVEDGIKLEAIAILEDRRSLFLSIPSLKPDLVFIGLRSGESDDVAHTLSLRIPLAKIVAIGSDGSAAFVHEMGMRRCALQDFGIAELIQAITRSLSEISFPG